MILDFSTLGSGNGKNVDLCGSCKYSVKVSYQGRVPQRMWLTGAQITEQFGSQHVKITVLAIKRCVRHAARGKEGEKGAAFLNAALNCGIDVAEDVDDYRTNILKQGHPNVR